eukprot:7179426-Prorocentrum_lima.AAC.1
MVGKMLPHELGPTMSTQRNNFQYDVSWISISTQRNIKHGTWSWSECIGQQVVLATGQVESLCGQ